MCLFFVFFLNYFWYSFLWQLHLVLQFLCGSEFPQMLFVLKKNLYFIFTFGRYFHLE